MSSQPPYTPDPQPTLVAYLEEILERARAGEVAFFIASAGVTPPGKPGEFDAKIHVALGSRITRWHPTSRRAAYATVLDGLQKGAAELDKNFQTVTPTLFLGGD